MTPYHIMIFGDNVQSAESFTQGLDAMSSFESAVADNALCFYGPVEVVVRNETNGLIIKFTAER